MFCSNCGERLSEQAKFCSSCGAVMQDKDSKGSPIGGSIGFSSRISDPAFSKYVKNANKWSWIFSLILASAAVIGFYIAGETNSEMDNPGSLFIGLGIGGMFLIIAMLQIIGRKKSRTWDGVVVDKKVEQKRRKRYTSQDNYYWENYTVFTVFIRDDRGKIQTIRVENDDTIFNYYRVNDRIRHHAGLNSYEKYDKSEDSIIFCLACATRHNISDDTCIRCKCPLPK